MSAARITMHKSVTPGRWSVRYGTPSSFDFLGVITKVADGCYTAHDADGVELGTDMHLGLRRDALAVVVDSAFYPAVPTCRWFALCDNDAAGVVHHPVLGDVPTCQRCATTHGLDLVGGAS